MKNQKLALAKLLKEESSNILETSPIWKPFTKYGKILLSGSAELDLLVYPDLDVYFDSYNPNVNVLKIFGEATSKGAELPHVVSMRLEKELHKVAHHIPKGIYLQMKLRVNSRIWQIDIWHLESEKELYKNLNETEALKGKIHSDPTIRKIILEAKHAIKRADGSTPSFASYYVYQAVINKGLIDIDAIKNYIKQQNL